MISEDCFFVVLGSSLICWDFKAHKQYQLSVAHARRLIFLIYNQDCIDQNCMVDQELIRAGVVKITQEQTDYWGWDVLSRIFHFGTKNIPLDDIPQSEEAWAKLYLEHCDGAWARPLPIDYAHVGGEAGILLPRKTCEGQLEQSGLFISLSPLAGSVLQQYFGWAGSFQVFVVLAVVVLVLSLKLLQEKPTSRGSARVLSSYQVLLRDRAFLISSLFSCLAFACHFHLWSSPHCCSSSNWA
ncbi:TPA: hypothetical protein ACIRVE_000331 [Pseudomonas putida]